MSGTVKRIVCVLCPKGCVLEVREAEPGGADNRPEVTGNGCKKGIEYGIQELVEPLRTLTTTVRTVVPGFPRLPVRTTADVPLRRMRNIWICARGLSCPSGFDG
jgi:CxxC motif-containing protein